MKKILCSLVGFLTALFARPSVAWAIGMTPLLVAGAVTVGAIFPAILFLYINQGGSGCWFCPLYTAAFDVINTIATQIYIQLAPSFLMFVAVMGALWLAAIVLKYFMTLNVPNTCALMTDLFKAVGRITVGAAILMSSVSFIFNYTVNPVIIFSGGLSTQILNSAGMSNGFVTEISRDGTSVSRTRNPLCTATPANDARFYTNNGEPKALSPEAYDTTLCMLKTMSLELIFGMAMGATFIVASFTTNQIWGVLPNLYMTIIGIIIFLGFFALYIVFPFKLIDIIVRVGFVIALMPLYVLFWVFPVTRAYVKKGWDMLVSAMFTLVALAVLMVISIRLLTAGINIDAMVRLLAKGEILQAMNLMSLSGVSIFVTFVSAFMAVKVIGMAPALGSAFGGASQSTTLGNSAWAMSAKGTKIVGKYGKKAATAIYGAHAAGNVGGQVGANPTPGSGSGSGNSRGSGSPKPFSGGSSGSSSGSSGSSGGGSGSSGGGSGSSGGGSGASK